MRVIHAEFPALVPDVPSSPSSQTAPSTIVKPEEPVGHASSRPETAPSENASTAEQGSEDTWSASKELNSFEQKLSLESILRSL